MKSDLDCLFRHAVISFYVDFPGFSTLSTIHTHSAWKTKELFRQKTPEGDQLICVLDSGTMQGQSSFIEEDPFYCPE